MTVSSHINPISNMTLFSRDDMGSEYQEIIILHAYGKSHLVFLQYAGMYHPRTTDYKCFFVSTVSLSSRAISRLRALVVGVFGT